MIVFDFMHDAELRKVLENDYQELEKCLEANAWKAVHVLAGSIIECVLIDYLMETNYEKRTSKKLKSISLFELINICKDENILSSKAADLSHVIREYRNLIHPEKVARLKENADEEGAVVAKSLVKIVVKEVAARRKQTYGYTAEQIIKKIETDIFTSSILTDLLKETKESEQIQLLIKEIPNKYFALSRTNDGYTPPYYILRGLEKCYRLILDASSDDVKTLVAKNLVTVIKEEDSETIEIFETKLFRGYDLTYNSPEEIQTIISHLMLILENNPAISLLENIKTIGRFLTREQALNYLDLVIKNYIGNKDVNIMAYLDVEHQSMDASIKAAILERLDTWTSHYKINKRQDLAGEVALIKMTLEFELDDHPF